MDFPTENKFGDIWSNKSFESSLKDWQISQLGEIASNVEAKCLLKIWFSNSYMMKRNSLNTSHDENFEESRCPIIWDGVHCWPSILAGTNISKSCTEIFQETRPQYAPSLMGHVTRECLENETWAEGNVSNYKECTDSFTSYLDEMDEDNFLVPMVHHMLFFGSIASLVCLVTSLTIFCFYRSLRCDRVTVRVHLMFSLVIRFVLMLIITEPFVIGHENSYRDVEILCESVLVLFLYSTFASASWMFIQGLYLNLALMVGTAPISARYQLPIYNFIGWVVPAAFVVVYVVAMLFKDQESCWTGYSEMKEMWILMVPIAFELVVNGLFLINILRVLVRKVRNSHSRPDSSQLKAAAKATAILFPVLGINNLILLYNPGGDYNKYFVTLNTFFASTQGIFVAIVYCFADKEVCAAIRRSIERANSRRMDNVNRVGLVPSLSTVMERLSRRQNGQSSSINLESSV